MSRIARLCGLAKLIALQLTESAREVLKGQRSIQMRRPLRKKPSSARVSAAPASPLSAADETLFQLLRKWRADTAREQSVPAYVILHDKTLRELAEVRPVSPAGLVVAHDSRNDASRKPGENCPVSTPRPTTRTPGIPAPAVEEQHPLGDIARKVSSLTAALRF